MRSIELRLIKRTNPRLLRDMEAHYSQPKGFVGRNLCYAVSCNNVYYGAIVAGSATRHLPGRGEFLQGTEFTLYNIVNNLFFHIEKQNGEYPVRNFAQKVLATWRSRVVDDWLVAYGNVVVAFEALVELPRTGEVYQRDGWTHTGITKGYTCKRISLAGRAGIKQDSWGGVRKWDTDNLRPKNVFMRRL